MEKVLKIFSSKKLPGNIYQELSKKGFEINIWEKEKDISREELIEACKNVDILIYASYLNLDKETLDKLKTVKLICLYSVGFNHVDIAYANSIGKRITNTPEVLSKATADTAFLLMLATSRKAFYLANTIRTGDWGSFNPSANLGQELDGKTLGIIGLGKIGYFMAQRCRDAFGMRIVYHNRSINNKAEKDLDAQYLSLDELYAQSDVISIHTDLNPSTKHLINMDAFKKMKKNLILVNTARGEVINQEDLVKALEQNLIWGAGLDVTTPEPLPSNHELLNFPQVCILPHIGSATKETREAMSKLIMQNILAYVENKDLITEVKI